MRTLVWLLLLLLVLMLGAASANNAFFNNGSPADEATPTFDNTGCTFAGSSNPPNANYDIGAGDWLSERIGRGHETQRIWGGTIGIWTQGLVGTHVVQFAISTRPLTRTDPTTGVIGRMSAAFDVTGVTYASFLGVNWSSAVPGWSVSGIGGGSPAANSSTFPVGGIVLSDYGSGPYYWNFNDNAGTPRANYAFGCTNDQINSPWYDEGAAKTVKSRLLYQGVTETLAQDHYYQYTGPTAGSVSNLTFTLSPLTNTELIARWGLQVNASYYHLHINTTPGFTPSSNDYRANTTQRTASASGLTPDTSYCGKVVAYSGIGVALNTSVEACATTQPSDDLSFCCNFTRVIPDNVTIYIARSESTDYLVDCIRADSGGAIQNACVVDAWPATDGGNNYTFRYPQSILTNTSTGMAATYFLYVTTLNGTFVGGQTFCIQTTYSATCSLTVGADLETQLGTITAAENNAIQVALDSVASASQETTIRNQFNVVLDVLTRSDIILPNIIWFYVAMVMLTAMSIARGHRGSGQ